MKRLFIGLNFSLVEKQHFSDIQKQVEKHLEKGRLSDISNFHVTLQFIGAVPDELISNVKEVMDATSFEPVKLVFNHIGYFQKKNRYVIYIGCEPNEKLTSLASELNRRLAMCGLVQESDAYVPHLTLARNALVDVSKLSTVDVFYECVVDEMTLYESTRVNDELTYLPLYVVN